MESEIPNNEESNNSANVLLVEVFSCNCGFKGELKNLVLKPRYEWCELLNGTKEMVVDNEWFCPNCNTELHNDFCR